MSLTSIVPPSLPSLVQSSAPFVPSSARKKRVPSTSAEVRTLDDREPGRMSLTITVPALVPSVFQSSLPCVPSLAPKKSAPFEFANALGLELEAPARMSFSIAVPAAVPSLFQGSCSPSSGTKTSRPFTSWNSVSRSFCVAWNAVIGKVPLAVPSLRQSCWPSGPVAENHSSPPTLPRACGEELVGPGTMSATRTVPATVPSLFQSSTLPSGKTTGGCVVPSFLKNKVPPAFVSSCGQGSSGYHSTPRTISG